MKLINKIPLHIRLFILALLCIAVIVMIASIPTSSYTAGKTTVQKEIQQYTTPLYDKGGKRVLHLDRIPENNYDTIGLFKNLMLPLVPIKIEHQKYRFYLSDNSGVEVEYKHYTHKMYTDFWGFDEVRHSYYFLGSIEYNIDNTSVDIRDIEFITNNKDIVNTMLDIMLNDVPKLKMYEDEERKVFLKNMKIN